MSRSLMKSRATPCRTSFVYQVIALRISSKGPASLRQPFVAQRSIVSANVNPQAAQ